MKRFNKIISICCIACLVFMLLYNPIGVYAEDTNKTILSKTINDISEYSDAGNYASAHKNIYDSENTLIFAYDTSTSDYILYKEGNTTGIHLTDAQVTAILSSNKTLNMIINILSDNNLMRGLYVNLGIITTKGSDEDNKIFGIITGSTDYLNALNYNTNTQTITINSNSADKIKEEIRNYYYKKLNVSLVKSSGKPSDGVYKIRTTYEDNDKYNNDLTIANDFDYAFYTNDTRDDSGYTLSMFNKKDVGYLFLQVDTPSSWNKHYILYYSNDGITSYNTYPRMKVFYNKYNTASYRDYNYAEDTFAGYGGYPYNLPYTIKIYPEYIKGKSFTSNPASTAINYLYYHDDYFESAFYSKDGSPLIVFKSLSALYDYIHNNQTSYLTKTINDTSKDVSFSTKGINNDLNSKMNELMTSINEQKAGLSSDELQAVIDEGAVEIVTPETEDITTSGKRSVKVKASQDPTFSVSIPKQITLPRNTDSITFDISITGDIYGNQKVTINTPETVEMKDSKGKTDKISANISLEITEYGYKDILDTKVTTGNTISISKLTAGEWSGNVVFTIGVEDK